MNIVLFIVILCLIAVIPNGIWVSIVIFAFWFLHKMMNFQVIRIEIIKEKNQNEFDSKTLEEMK